VPLPGNVGPSRRFVQRLASSDAAQQLGLVLAPDQDVGVVFAHAVDRTLGSADDAIGLPNSEIITLLSNGSAQLPSRNPPEHVAAPQPPSRLHRPADPRGAAQNAKEFWFMWMIETPNPFTPRDEMRAFLKRMAAHPDAGHPDIKRAVAEVEGYLKQPDPRIEAEWRAKNPCTIDWPPPWARKRVMRAFLRKMAAHPDPDHPDVKFVVGRVEGYLALAEKEPRRSANKAPLPPNASPFQAIVHGWMVIDNWDALTRRIERVAAWVRKNGPLDPDEAAILRLMIERQTAMDAIIEEALKVTPREEMMDRLPKPLAMPKGSFDATTIMSPDTQSTFGWFSG